MYSQLPDRLQKAVALSREKGASTWLTVLPLTEHGFTLHKSAFHDALALRYGWVPARLSTKCGCGNNFSVEHALSCATGGFPTIRHNEIRDITASLLTEVYKEVCVEPELQPVTSDQLNGASANRQDGARLDVSANGVWGGRFQKTFFDVRVFNPLAPSNQSQTPAATFRKHELEKKRAYQQRVQDIEHSSFTPLVLSVTGGMGVEATTFYKRLAALLSQKWDSPYSKKKMSPEFLPNSLCTPSNKGRQILPRASCTFTYLSRPHHHRGTHITTINYFTIPVFPL